MKYEWLSVKIAIICVIVGVIQWQVPSFTDQFALVSSDVLSRPWILITHMFLHGSFQHIFYNMFALVVFGSVLEKIVGGKKFLFIFFASGLAAALGSIIFYGSSIGASGAIYGIFGMLTVLRPKMTVYTGFLFPVPMVVAVVLWSVGDIAGIIAPSENIAYAAHVFGLAFGLAYGFYVRRKYEIKRKETESVITEREFRDWEKKWVSSSDPYL